jgi:hypothetical protein
MVKPKAKPNFGKHTEWKSEPVLWVTRDGVLHIARSAATMLGANRGGVVSKVLCGGGSTFCPEATTWYDMKRRGHRFCRKCVKALAERP